MFRFRAGELTMVLGNGANKKSDRRTLLDFKEKLDNILKACFSNNDKFITSLKVDYQIRMTQFVSRINYFRTLLRVSSIKDKTSQPR